MKISHPTGFFVTLMILFGFIIFAPGAMAIECYQVDGMSIFGWDTCDDEYKFIGAISNEYGSESIANEYGAGNEYSSDSIFNDYGDFGGDYSSESAFNDYASNPPIIINDDYEFVSYLTTNNAKSPSINTYLAIACAKESWASSNSDHEDFTFSKLPSMPSYGGGYSEEELRILLQLLQKQCSANATNTGGTCYCNTGYKTNSDRSACVPAVPNQQQTPPAKPPSGGKMNADGSCSLSSYRYVRGRCMPVTAAGKSTPKKLNSSAIDENQNNHSPKVTRTRRKTNKTRIENVQERAKARSKK